PDGEAPRDVPGHGRRRRHPLRSNDGRCPASHPSPMTIARNAEAPSLPTEPTAAASPWAPLGRALFRSLWFASLASNVGTWMQSVAAVWLMTSLTPAPVMA